MNRPAAALILLFVSIGIGLSGHFYINKSAENLIEYIEYDRNLTVESGTPSAERAEKIQNEWKKRETLFVAILPHSELDEIEISIMNLTDFQKQEFGEEYIKALNECINRLEHIRETQKPDFKNIF